MEQDDYDTPLTPKMAVANIQSSVDAENAIITPFRYTIVEDGLFRGAYPRKMNFVFLKRQGYFFLTFLD